MYKMKEICEKTGLTERTIRYYIEEQLIQPIVEDGVHRKAYFFNEEHVQTLKDILEKVSGRVLRHSCLWELFIGIGCVQTIFFQSSNLRHRTGLCIRQHFVRNHLSCYRDVTFFTRGKLLYSCNIHVLFDGKNKLYSGSGLFIDIGKKL